LLLGRSPRIIKEARQRIANQLGQTDELSEMSRFAMSESYLSIEEEQ